MGFRIAPAEQHVPRKKRPRAKNEHHLAFIRGLPCATCGDSTSTEAAHLRMASDAFAKQEAGIGQKPDDAWTLPLCNWHHELQHKLGEAVFWAISKIDPFILALALWKHSGDYEAALIVLRNAR